MTSRPEVPWTVLAGYRGSQAHGTHMDSAGGGVDDVDVMHVVVPPPPFYAGLEQYGSRGTLELVDGPWDVVAYEARKFTSLLCKGNPNVLALLWLGEARGAGWLETTEAGWRLVQAREWLTLTRATVTSHIGYAEAQRAKMARRPTDQAYMGARRRALAERHGYDVKAAAHVVRLLGMLLDLMREGRLTVDRTGRDAERLVAIKAGEVALPLVLDEIAALLVKCRWAEARLNWPARPDRASASALCVDVVATAWAESGWSLAPGR